MKLGEFRLPALTGPGSDFYVANHTSSQAPFRWDQFLHGVVFSADDSMIGKQAVLSPRYQQIKAMCEVAGGTFRVTLAKDAHQVSNICKLVFQTIANLIAPPHYKSTHVFSALIETMGTSYHAFIQLYLDEHHARDKKVKMVALRFNRTVSSHASPQWMIPDNVDSNNTSRLKFVVSFFFILFIFIYTLLKMQRPAHPTFVCRMVVNHIKLPPRFPLDAYDVSDCKVVQRLRLEPDHSAMLVYLHSDLNTRLTNPFGFFRKDDPHTVRLYVTAYDFPRLLQALNSFPNFPMLSEDVAMDDTSVGDTKLVEFPLAAQEFVSYLESIPPYYTKVIDFHAFLIITLQGD